MAHITIPDDTPVDRYTVGSTPQSAFTITFVFFESDGSDINVFVDGTLQSDADYTITGNSGTDEGFDGGTLTLDSAVSNVEVVLSETWRLKEVVIFQRQGRLMLLR